MQRFKGLEDYTSLLPFPVNIPTINSKRIPKPAVSVCVMSSSLNNFSLKRKRQNAVIANAKADKKNPIHDLNKGNYILTGAYFKV